MAPLQSSSPEPLDEGDQSFEGLRGFGAFRLDEDGVALARCERGPPHDRGAPDGVAFARHTDIGGEAEQRTNCAEARAAANLLVGNYDLARSRPSRGSPSLSAVCPL